MKRTTPNWLAAIMIGLGGFAFGYTFFNEYGGVAFLVMGFSITAYATTFVKPKEKKKNTKK